VAALARFLLRRLLGIAVLAWATTAATFALLRVGIPNPGIDAALSRQLGPGRPAVEQYFGYLGHLLHGHLGQSLVQPVSVNTILGQAIPPTLSLLAGGMILWLAAGVAAPVRHARRPVSAPGRPVQWAGAHSPPLRRSPGRGGGDARCRPA
jgi:peptide/nickel transport system permease protein